MNIETVIQKIDKLIQDVTQITSSFRGQTPKQLDEHLRSWEARAYEEVRNCGLIDAAERFANATPHQTRVNNYQGNLLNKSEAKKANLTALLAEKNNSAFYEDK